MQDEFNFEVEPTHWSGSWQEVPQARFLSWSEERQLTYCAMRDEDSAQVCEPEDEQFYLERAKGYRDAANQG